MKFPRLLSIVEKDPSRKLPLELVIEARQQLEQETAALEDMTLEDAIAAFRGQLRRKIFSLTLLQKLTALHPDVKEVRKHSGVVFVLHAEAKDGPFAIKLVLLDDGGYVLKAGILKDGDIDDGSYVFKTGVSKDDIFESADKSFTDLEEAIAACKAGLLDPVKVD